MGTSKRSAGALVCVMLAACASTPPKGIQGTGAELAPEAREVLREAQADADSEVYCSRHPRVCFWIGAGAMAAFIAAGVISDQRGRPHHCHADCEPPPTTLPSCTGAPLEQPGITCRVF
jgi:hypothetical protein